MSSISLGSHDLGIKGAKALVTVRSFNQAMSQLFQSTMRESNPKLTPELFDHNSASETAIEIPKNALGR